jgi:hypothetical protein
MLQETITLKNRALTRFFKEVDVQKNTRKKKFRPYRIDEEFILDTDSGLPLMQRCQKILGKRMEQRWQGYYLDGKPSSSSKIALAAGFSI